MLEAHLSLPVAAFVFSDTWFAVLLGVHILGAVIGLGPTFTFGLLGGMSGKASPEGGVALLDAIDRIDTRIVNPILLTTQPLTGALLIWNRGLNNDFFTRQRLWLIGGILAYVIATIIALGIMGPTVRRLIRMARGGQGGTPEFMTSVRTTQVYGPILTLLGLVILVLMIWKPGSGCAQLQC